MAMKLYRFLQFAPFSVVALSSLTASVDMTSKILGVVLLGGIVLVITTVCLNVLWSIFGLWPRPEA